MTRAAPAAPESRAVRVRRWRRPPLPLGGHGDLLVAALHDDRVTAALALARWIDGVDLDALDAGGHRLLPALAMRIEAVAAVSPALAARVSAAARYAWLRNQAAVLAVRPLLDAFDVEGVPWMALKGAALAGSGAAPGGVGYRPMTDLDIAVPEAEVHRAVRVLLDAGATGRMAGHLAGPDAAEVVHAVHSAAFSFAGSELDLHWRAAPQVLPPDVEARRWEGSEVIRLCGRDARVPSPTEQALLAVEHGAVWASDLPIRWVVDLVGLLRAGRIDHDRLAWRAAELRRAVTVAAALEVAESVAGPLPGAHEARRALARRCPSIGELVAALRTRRGDGGPEVPAAPWVEAGFVLERLLAPGGGPAASRRAWRAAAVAWRSCRRRQATWSPADRAAVEAVPPPVTDLRPVDEWAVDGALGPGWSTPEPGGRWTAAPLAVLHLPAARPDGTTVGAVAVRALAPLGTQRGADEPSRVRLRAGAASVDVALGDTPTTLVVPAAPSRRRRSTITLTIEAEPRCPAEIGIGSDLRRLGVWVEAVGLLDAPPGAAPPGV